MAFDWKKEVDRARATLQGAEAAQKLLAQADTGAISMKGVAGGLLDTFKMAMAMPQELRGPFLQGGVGFWAAQEGMRIGKQVADARKAAAEKQKADAAAASLSSAAAAGGFDLEDPDASPLSAARDLVP
jgi:hypothetical protein